MIRSCLMFGSFGMQEILLIPLLGIIGVIIYYFANARDGVIKKYGDHHEIAKKREQELQNSDPREIINDMSDFTKQIILLSKDYDYNKSRGGISKTQYELGAQMNHIVKAEWNPRLKILKERRESLINDIPAYSAFTEFQELDDYMKSLTTEGIIKADFIEFASRATHSLKKVAGYSLATAAATVAVGGKILKNAGKDIGNYPKSKTVYRDTDGNLYDEGGNRVPY